MRFWVGIKTVSYTHLYLAKRYGKTTWTVSTTLKKLQEKGYIKMEYEFEGKEVKKRYIYPYLDLSKGGIDVYKRQS